MIPGATAGKKNIAGIRRGVTEIPAAVRRLSGKPVRIQQNGGCAACVPAFSGVCLQGLGPTLFSFAGFHERCAQRAEGG